MRSGDFVNLFFNRISLVTTCKGRLAQLRETIDGCLGQNDPDFEYVVVELPEGEWNAPGINLSGSSGRDISFRGTPRNFPSGTE